MDYLFGTEVLTLSAQRVLRGYGSHPVTELVIFRTPLSKVLTLAIDVVSLGTYQKELKKQEYDSLFHLGVCARVKGKWIQIDKQSNVKVEVVGKVPDGKGTEQKEVSLTSNKVTLNEFIERTVKYMGREKFKEYDGRSNNCQVFVNALLSANGLATSETSRFVKQDTEWLFTGRNPYLQDIMRRLTDTMAEVDSGVDKVQNLDVAISRGRNKTLADDPEPKPSWKVNDLVRESEERETLAD